MGSFFTIYARKNGVSLEMSLKNKVLHAKACYGWEKLLLYATMLILQIRKSFNLFIFFHIMLFVIIIVIPDINRGQLFRLFMQHGPTKDHQLFQDLGGLPSQP